MRRLFTFKVADSQILCHWPPNNFLHFLYRQQSRSYQMGMAQGFLGLSCFGRLLLISGSYQMGGCYSYLDPAKCFGRLLLNLDPAKWEVPRDSWVSVALEGCRYACLYFPPKCALVHSAYDFVGLL